MRDGERFIRLPEVCSLTGLSRGSVYRFMREGSFPSNFDLTGAQAKAWLASEVRAWMMARHPERPAGQLVVTAGCSCVGG